jgi:hypothetical protein
MLPAYFRPPARPGKPLLPALVLTGLVATLPAIANPSSDRAFAVCITSANAHFALTGERVSSIIMIARAQQAYTFRVNSTALRTPQQSIECLANDQQTVIAPLASAVASIPRR